MILIESLLYGLGALILGGIIGTGLWYLLVREMSNIRFSAFQLPWRELGISAASLGLITLASGYFPLRRIRRKTIIDNIRKEE